MYNGQISYQSFSLFVVVPYKNYFLSIIVIGPTVIDEHGITNFHSTLVTLYKVCL